MAFYWIEMETGAKGTVSAENTQEAINIAESLHNANMAQVHTLPYPAEPCWNAVGMPCFCWKPEQCKGHTSCPQRLACTE